MRVIPVAADQAVTTQRLAKPSRERKAHGRSWTRPASAIVISMAVTWLVITTVGNVLWNPEAWGYDYRFYQAVGARWLADGSYYWPYQLAGPYDFTMMVDVLYPPNALYLFVPFAVLPAILWWSIPAAVLVYVVASYRPLLWAVAVMFLCLCYGRAQYAWVMGNTDIWMTAAVAAGLRWGWPVVFLFLKPTMAPLTLIGIRRRSWWVAVAVVAVLSLPQLPLWFDYLAAMRNLSLAADYSLGSLPILAVPVVAWLARTK